MSLRAPVSSPQHRLCVSPSKYVLQEHLTSLSASGVHKPTMAH